MKRSYITLFFSQLYCVDKVLAIDLSSFDRPQSKPLLFQCFTALAGAMRVFDEDGKHLDFENQARQLAGELFDHVDIETAIGMHLLGRHLLSHDFEKAEHFRDVASSMCKRI